ncbi:MAG TPA: apolipoprotein N-acyltransferase, partial [Steroidobacteraceae bacterium]|nr:apolipoprotein N-acyltransferase [Steroidobacteraceae bacterium]
IMLGMAALMASYFTVYGYLQARWIPAAGLWRYIVALPALWVLCEWWRGWFVSGFPWMSLGYAQIDTPLSGYAPVAGVYGITYACALIAGSLAMLVVGSRWQRVVAIVALIAPCAGAYVLWNKVWTESIREPISVAVVQGAVPQDLKWSQEWRDKTLKHYHDLAAPYFGNKLMVWPEAALPDISSQLLDYLSMLWGEAHATDTDIVMGLLHDDPNTGNIYNGVLAMSNDVQWYHKAHLVPFGEYFPVPAFIRRWMRMMSLPHDDLTRGDAVQKPLDAAGEKLSASVCYEDGFAAEQLYALRTATLMVNVTNDAWFGDSIAAPQHLEISRMRALESGRDLIRAANDGISAIIGSDGKVRARLPRFKAMVLTGTVQPRTGLTPYARVGNWPVIIGCTLLALLAWASTRLNRIFLNGKNKHE